MRSSQFLCRPAQPRHLLVRFTVQPGNAAGFSPAKLKRSTLLRMALGLLTELEVSQIPPRYG
jgi:hypothetical protein